MQLYYDSTGKGPELLLLHGWAMHSGVWDSVRDKLAGFARVTRVDLPGHGRSRSSNPDSLAAMAAAVMEIAPPKAIWVGWSLGGMVAMRAALDAPTRLAGLMLVSSTPRFVSAVDWPAAIPVDTLAQFTRELTTNYETTVRRFLSLQVQGDCHARETLRCLRTTVLAEQQPSAESLRAGLNIMRNSDLRAELPSIELPAQVLSGSRDRLTPPRAGKWTAAQLQAPFLEFKGAAHALFISHPEEFIAAVRTFVFRCHNRNTPRAGASHVR